MNTMMHDDETCWCGVPMDGHDDLIAASGGPWHHPDPLAAVTAPLPATMP